MYCLNFIDLRGRRLVLRTFELKRAEATLQVDINLPAAKLLKPTRPALPFCQLPMRAAFRRDLPPARGGGR